MRSLVLVLSLGIARSDYLVFEEKVQDDKNVGYMSHAKSSSPAYGDAKPLNFEVYTKIKAGETYTYERPSSSYLGLASRYPDLQQHHRPNENKAHKKFIPAPNGDVFLSYPFQVIFDQQGTLSSLLLALTAYKTANVTKVVERTGLAINIEDDDSSVTIKVSQIHTDEKKSGFDFECKATGHVESEGPKSVPVQSQTKLSADFDDFQQDGGEVRTLDQTRLMEDGEVPVENQDVEHPNLLGNTAEPTTTFVFEGVDKVVVDFGEYAQVPFSSYILANHSRALYHCEQPSAVVLNLIKEDRLLTLRMTKKTLVV